MRLVLDTNTVVSALLWRGTPHQLVMSARTRPVTLFTSTFLLAELAEVLSRKKLASAVAASRTTPEQLMEIYRRMAVVIQPTPVPATVLNDPDDDNVLACALGANSNFIVSGDRDLLAIKMFRAIPIMTAAEVLSAIAAL